MILTLAEQGVKLEIGIGPRDALMIYPMQKRFVFQSVPQGLGQYDNGTNSRQRGWWR
jgi:hypothetical protein